jgi:hypothetical protein
MIMGMLNIPTHREIFWGSITPQVLLEILLFGRQGFKGNGIWRDIFFIFSAAFSVGVWFLVGALVGRLQIDPARRILTIIGIYIGAAYL